MNCIIISRFNVNVCIAYHGQGLPDGIGKIYMYMIFFDIPIQ